MINTRSVKFKSNNDSNVKKHTHISIIKTYFWSQNIYFERKECFCERLTTIEQSELIMKCRHRQRIQKFEEKQKSISDSTSEARFRIGTDIYVRHFSHETEIELYVKELIIITDPH